ncbi:hypothetical protein A3Q56_01888 [Intoshia linei]|uniref:Uncharacterized protein n=1 Tax=Intoshia linei TaxID=1819745 RepID=A0A177B7V0_9BILA|nr:hypothetical protein A3Q56_01888 [Intoshia linei]
MEKFIDKPHQLINLNENLNQSPQEWIKDFEQFLLIIENEYNHKYDKSKANLLTYLLGKRARNRLDCKKLSHRNKYLKRLQRNYNNKIPKSGTDHELFFIPNLPIKSKELEKDPVNSKTCIQFCRQLYGCYQAWNCPIYKAKYNIE